MIRSTRLALGTLLLAGTLAAAEEPRFGVQVHGNIPTGDLKTAVDAKLGVGGGAQVTFDLGDGHMIRPRLDYTFFPEATVSAIRNKVNSLAVGADYMFFPAGKPEGLYLTGGLALHHWKVEGSVGALSFSDTSNKPGFAAGLGYNFNPSFGAEVRAVSTKYGTGSKDFTATMLQAGVTLRF